MAESSWPSPDNTRLVTDLQYEQMMAAYVPSGLIGTPGDTSVVTADGAGTREIIIRSGKYGYVRGHIWYSGTSNVRESCTANASGNPRVDLVVLRLTRSTWNVTVEIVAGTPAASPAAPTPTQDLGTTGVYEIPIAEIAVANGATVINSGDVTARDYYLSRPPWIGVAASLPATGTYNGQEWRSSDRHGVHKRWNGTGWKLPIVGPAAMLRRAGAVQTIPNNTNTDIVWDTEDADWGTSGMWTSGADITVQEAGLYIVTASSGIQTSASTQRELQVKVNGTTIANQKQITVDNGDDCLTVTAPHMAAANDVVTIGIYQNSGSGKDTSSDVKPRVCVFCLGSA